MSIVRQIFINYANNQQAYYPGQTVSGNVFLEIVQPLAPKRVSVVLRGRAHVYWTETSGTGDDRRTHTYSDNEQYFDHAIVVWPSALSADSPAILPPGMHSFSFTFSLPLGIPSSFELSTYSTAYIRYWIVANVDLGSSQFKCQRPFTVIEYIDVNEHRLLVPMRSENEKMICCLCCESGPLRLQASIDRVGFCPGEAVVVSATAENITNRVMRGIRVSLIAVTRRTAHGASSVISRTVCELMGEAIAVGATDRWENRRFPIPPVPPSIKTCRIIDQSYYIQLSVVVPNGFNLNIHFPIVIGTVPLRQDIPRPLQQVMHVESRTENWLQLPESSITSQVASTVPVHPPPYAEATGITVDIRDNDDRNAMGVVQYTPLLPFVSSERPTANDPFHVDVSLQPHSFEMPGPLQYDQTLPDSAQQNIPVHGEKQHHSDPYVTPQAEPFGDSHIVGSDAIPMRLIEPHSVQDMHDKA